MTPGFMFATGVENSSPTIGDGRVRIDEIEECALRQARLGGRKEQPLGERRRVLGQQQ